MENHKKFLFNYYELKAKKKYLKKNRKILV